MAVLERVRDVINEKVRDKLDAGLVDRQRCMDTSMVVGSSCAGEGRLMIPQGTMYSQEKYFQGIGCKDLIINDHLPHILDLKSGEAFRCRLTKTVYKYLLNLLLFFT